MRTRAAPRAPFVVVAAAMVAALVHPAIVAGQTLLIQVLDGESGEGLTGALVHLVGPSDEAVRSLLTNAEGGALFVDLAPGAYRARVDMIGRASGHTALVTVGEGQLVREVVRLGSNPVAIRGLQVEADERCTVRPADGQIAHTVWTEARKALDVVALTERADRYRFRTVVYERDFDRDDRVIGRDSVNEREGLMRVPFESRPLLDLIENGFVQQGPQGDTYFAPDANALLSDPFLDTHCFTVRLNERSDSLVGLGFEPVDDRGVPDIRGVLWLEAATARLQSLDFRYTRLDPDVNTDEVGGSVHFRSLPSGDWIVHQWSIVTPSVSIVRDLRGDLVRRVMGYRESGGQVLEVIAAGGRSLGQTVATGGVEGVVLDSLGLPLRGAIVREQGSNQEVFSGVDGRFSLVRLGPGRRRLEVTHPSFEAYSLPAQSVTVEVVRGRMEAIELRVPSVSSALRAECASVIPDPDLVRGWEGLGTLFGRVSHTGDGVSYAERVRVRWRDYGLRQRGARIEVRTEAAEQFFSPIERGRYGFCTLPLNRTLEVSAMAGDEDLASVTLRIPPDAPIALRDIVVGRSR